MCYGWEITWLISTFLGMICFQKVTFLMSLNLNLHNLQACTLLISQDKETVVTNHFNHTLLDKH